MPGAIRHRNLPQLLLQSREALMAHFRPHLNAHGITEQQWRILRALFENGPLEPRQLCERCLISSPSITGVLSRMEEAGLVAREKMDHDQRRLKITATPRAVQIGRTLAARVDAQYEAIERQVGTKKLQEVYDVLDALLQMLEAPAADDVKPAARRRSGG